MAVFRFLAFVFLLVAVLALVTDATPWSYGEGPFVAKSLGEHWTDLAPSTLAAVDGFLTRTAPAAESLVFKPLIAMPTALIFGLLAVLSGYLGRRRHRIEIFAN